MKAISILVIIALALPFSAGAEDRLLGTKTLGKLTMIAILSVTAFAIKVLIDRDQREVDRLHEDLGSPDRIIEFQEGFDHWRVEWYENGIYIFRNGILYKKHLDRGEK